MSDYHTIQLLLTEIAKSLGDDFVTKSEAREMYDTFCESSGSPRDRVYAAMMWQFNETPLQFAHRLARGRTSQCELLLPELERVWMERQASEKIVAPVPNDPHPLTSLFSRRVAMATEFR